MINSLGETLDKSAGVVNIGIIVGAAFVYGRSGEALVSSRYAQ